MRTTPVLCRLCKCPVADDGVRIDQLDAEKLSEWWFCKFEAEFNAENCNDELLCQFCLWNARFEYENSTQEAHNGPVDWWSGNDNNQAFYKYFYCDEIIKQCSVDLGVKISIQNHESSHVAEVEARGNTSNRIGKHWKNSQCSFCGEQFPKLSLLLKHMVKIHADIKTFKCNSCNKFFTTEEERRKHQDSIHNYECIYCENSKIYHIRSQLHNHVRSKHQIDKIHQCNINLSCREFVQTEQDILKHIQLCHNSAYNKFKCLCCKISLSSSFKLKRHMQSFHSGQFILCGNGIGTSGQCSRVFLTEEEKSKHILQSHAINDSSYAKCILCSKSISKKNLSTHMFNIHKNDDYIRCSSRECITYFLSEEEKQKHEKLFHLSKSKGGRVMKCIFCNSLLVTKWAYKSHMFTVHESQLIDAYKCSSYYCPQYFLTENDRDEHIMTEHKKCYKPKYQCIYCDKSLKNNKVLRVHINSKHFDVKIQCKFHSCCLYFHSQFELDLHFQLRHRQKNVFQCSECHFTTGTRRSLSFHFNRKHKLNKKQCPKCPKSFVDNGILKTHLKRCHSNQTVSKCQYCNKKVKTMRAHQSQHTCQNCNTVLLCVTTARAHFTKCFSSRK